MTEELFNKILHVLKENRACVGATVVASQGSSPRHVGAKMFVFADGSIAGTIGGGGLEKLVTKDALEALKRKKSFLKTYSLDKKRGLQVCGGEVSIFLDVMKPSRTLIICGAGHIGLALSVMAKLLRFRVIVLDNRRDFANSKRFPHVDKIICGGYIRSLRKAGVDSKTSVVIVTHGHAHDAECLEAALETKAGYIGMIGSRKKIAFVFERLRKKGVSARRLRDVRAPIGLDIGAETPEEIAVAIAAELIQEDKKCNDPCPISNDP